MCLGLPTIFLSGSHGSSGPQIIHIKAFNKFYPLIQDGWSRKSDSIIQIKASQLPNIMEYHHKLIIQVETIF